MMSLDAVRDAVLGRARAEAGAKLAAAREEADKKLAEAREEDDRFLASALAGARRKNEDVRARELGQRRAEQRQELLAAKNRRIDAAFAEARRLFLALPPDGRIDAARAWLAAEAADVGGTLQVRPDDKDAFSACLDGLNQGRRAEARLTAVEGDASLSGGARIVGPSAVADGAIDSRLARWRVEATAEVASLLFALDNAKDAP